ncbi:MAG: hypothetical protein ACYTEZ_15030 [Planctomycetota bacterium]|jgi:hypothetical protein
MTGFSNRRTWALVALCACGVLLIPGCSEGDTFITTAPGGPVAAITTLFPGLDMSAVNRFADDKVAMTHSYSKIANGQFNVFWNCINGTALVIYVDNFAHMWVHFWNGTTFTESTELLATGQDFNIENDDNSDPRADDDDPFIVLFHVLWLNTAVQNRAGDAIITWVAQEGNDGEETTGDDRLYGTYFDVSAGTFGTPRALNDNTAGSDVQNFGFVSDSLCYSHDFFVEDRSDDEHVNQPEADLSGEATSFVFIVWSQMQATNDRFYALEFDLTQVGNSLPVQTAQGSGEIPAAPGKTLSATDVNSDFVVHNEYMIWQAATDDPATELFLTRFDAGMAPDTILLSSNAGAGSETDIPVAADVYGADHGLASLYAFFTETPAAIRSLHCAKSDVGVSPLARENQDIDAGANTVVNFTRPAPNRQPLFGGTRINRTATWIFVILNQSTGTVDHAFCNVVQTRLAGSGARTLADSVATAAEPPNHDPVADMRLTNLFGQNGGGFPRISVQRELAYGTCRPGDGIQSNPNRINFTVREATGLLATDPDNLFHNGVIFTAGAAGAPPTFAFAVTGAAPAGRIDIVRMDEDEAVTDGGTTDGAPVIYYLAQDTSQTPQLAGVEIRPRAENIRLFGYPAGGTGPQLVSTSTGTYGEFADVNRVRLHTTPRGGGAGSTVHIFFTEPPTTGGERETTGDIDANGRSLRTRYFNKSAYVGAPRGTAAQIDTAFAGAHMPPLSAKPVTLDHGINQEDTQIPPPLPSTDDNEMGPRVAFATSDGGSTVGIYFRSRNEELNEGGHFYYQQFSAGAWFSEPQVVDVAVWPVGVWPGNDNGVYVFPPRLSNSTNNYSRAMIFYAKPLHGNDNAIGKERRWFVQVHQ